MPRIPDPARSRLMLEFVYRAVPASTRTGAGRGSRTPRCSPSTACNDLPLARRYAAGVERYTTAPTCRSWAKQMEIFILEDMNELEAARIMLGGLLESGTHPGPGGDAAFSSSGCRSSSRAPGATPLICQVLDSSCRNPDVGTDSDNH